MRVCLMAGSRPGSVPLHGALVVTLCVHSRFSWPVRSLVDPAAAPQRSSAEFSLSYVLDT